MSRSTRLRKPPTRHRTDDPPPDDKKITSGLTKTQKGNGIIVKDALVELRSPVLRDRTNLTVESSKNIISKKGVGDKESNKVVNPPEMKKNNRGMRTRQRIEDPANDDKKITTAKKPTRGPSKSSKKSEFQVTEKEPEVTPEVDKPTKIPRLPRTTRKTSKTTDLSPQISESAPNTRAKRSDSLKNSVQVLRTTRSKTSSSSTSHKPPETVTKSSKSSTKSPKKSNEIERKSKRLIGKSSDKSPQKSEKKFFKNKRNMTLTHSKVSPMKKGLRNPKRPLTRKKNSSPSKLYQPTLAESFAKMKKSLRPRRTGKNYNEESIIEKKKFSNNNDDEDHPKAPVYKPVNVQEENAKDKNEVYEFSFDSNDSNERLPKKRKKKVVRKAPAKRPKKMVVSPTTSGTQNSNKISGKINEKISKAKSGLKTAEDNMKNASKAKKLNEDHVKIVKDNAKPVPTTSGTQNSNKISKKPDENIPEASASVKIVGSSMKNGSEVRKLNEDEQKISQMPSQSKKPEEKITPVPPSSSSSSSKRNSPIEDISERFEVTVDVHVSSDYPPSPPMDHSNPEATPTSAGTGIPPQKPKIVSNEKLEGSKRISLTSTPLHGNSNHDPRPGSTNLFNNRPSMQYKTMMNHSLIRRSFSPIVKQPSEIIDASSPWRPIATNTFSRVKNIFQSTPHGKKTLTPHGIHTLATGNKRVSTKINKIVEQNDENDNSSIIDNNSLRKSPRKFGTVLSNVGSSPGTSSSPRMPSIEDNSSVDDKENDNVTSSRKSPQRRIRTPMGSPLRPAEPQPGPSGVQTTGDNRVLKQSNLHGFLNIPDMPASTSITTAHGIFDDSCPAPIPGKAAKKITQDFDVGNAFGFEDESHGDFSPVIQNSREPATVEENLIKNVKSTVVKKKIEKPIRLPTRAVTKAHVDKDLDKIEQVDKDKVVDEINHQAEKDKWVSGNANENEDEDEDEDEDEEEKGVKMVSKKKNLEATKKDVVEAVHFLDTFDADERKPSPVEVPLFVDPEPVHFRQPPRYSYGKRKRGGHFNTSDETEDDFHSEGEDDDHPKRKQKKRKMTKAEREQQKKLDQWAKSINETFDEIDHFALVVE